MIADPGRSEQCEQREQREPVDGLRAACSLHEFVSGNASPQGVALRPAAVPDEIRALRFWRHPPCPALRTHPTLPPAPHRTPTIQTSEVEELPAKEPEVSEEERQRLQLGRALRLAAASANFGAST
jgi:hypothetical protein